MFTESDLKKMFDAYYNALVSYANNFLPSRDECEDVVQDVFVDMWETDNGFPNDIAIKAYLYKSTRNKCYNIIKHNTVKSKYADTSILLLRDENLFMNQIVEEEITRQLYDAINTLPERKREIIKLSLKGVKNQEVAETLNIKLQTVKTLKSQAYKLLRREFKSLSFILSILIANKKQKIES